MGAKEKHTSTSRSARKRTVKSSATKKTVKKVAKKTTKQAKKTEANKKKVTKKVTKKTVQKPKTKKTNTPVQEQNIDLQTDSNQVVFASKRPVASLVPRIQTITAAIITHIPQSPVNVHTFMSTTARVSGVAFVVLGAFFTAVLATNMPFVEGQSAQLIASTDSSDLSSGDIDVESRLEVNETSDGVTLLVETEAKGAEKVYVSARNNETEDLLPLGDSVENSSGNFTFTHKFKPADITKKYKIRVDVWHDLNVDEVQAEYVGTITIPAVSGDDAEDGDSSLSGTLYTRYSNYKTDTDQAVDTEEIDIPKILLDIPNDSIYKGERQLYAYINEAKNVEWYVTPAKSTVKQFLGKGVLDSGDKWEMTFNTKNLPNGVYSLFAEADTIFGTIVSENDVITIENEISRSSIVDELEEDIKEIKNEWEEVKINDSVTTEQVSESEINNESTLEEDKKEAEASFDKDTLAKIYGEQINILLNRLTAAKRSNNEKYVKQLEQKLSLLEIKITTDFKVSPDSEARALIASYFKDRIEDHKTQVDRQIQFIEERDRADLLQDTDSDGVSDYDEVTIFATDPTVADTDADGVIDGLEIEGGYDPLDSAPRRALVYESPKESGVERSDILAIHSFTSVKQDEIESADTANEKDEDRLIAHVEGKALPNSFVTLYIYSTPIVVTVKTDQDGNWEYTFDKELEDGEHTVYVGITDNSGQIVAKSAPYRFIKEAQAVTPIAQAAVDENLLTSEQTSFASQSSMLLIAAVSVVALGLVLILLGIFLESRQPRVRRESLSAVV